MSKGITDNKYYYEIADAIRDKNGETTAYKPSEMAEAIENIPSGGSGIPYGEAQAKYISTILNYTSEAGGSD